MRMLAWYILAAFAEIGGCFAFWVWIRLAKSVAWLIRGMVSLALFAWALTRIDSSHAARAYAAYGGIYVASSLIWLWVVEKTRPDRWDVIGATICISGTLIILFGPRTQ